MKAIKTFGKDLKYAFHVSNHPMDGFWDLKHEGRGRVYIAVFLFIMYIITSILDMQFNGYTFNLYAAFPQNISAGGTFMQTALLVVIWVAANWGFTTLFDGEGSMKDIFLYTGYAMLPLVLSQILLIPLTNVLTTNEATLITLITYIGVGWTSILIFMGTMVTHQYAGGKAFLTVICIIIGMGVIMFLGIMFFYLIQEIWNFIYTIYTELELRR